MKKHTLLVLIFSACTLFGCRDWLDINRTPNDAELSEVTDELLLTSCEYDMTNNHINSSNAMMISQHLTKSGEYSGSYTFLSGNIRPQDLDSWWETYYLTISNLKIIYDNSVKNGDKIHKGISQVLSILNYQRLVDIFGNIPYSESCQPLVYPQPKYDDAAAIYADMLNKIDVAIADIAAGTLDYESTMATAHTNLKKADIMCKGDLKLWARFANTIKLRLLMRVSNVQDVSAQITAIADKCLKIEENVLSDPGYYAENGKMNLFYENYGWDNQGAENTNHRQYMPTSAFVDMLRDNNDPRLRVYVNPRRYLTDHARAAYSKYGLGKEPYVGIPYGQASPATRYYCAWTGTGALIGSSDVKGGRIRSSTFLTGSEVGFFLAEAALRGLIPGGDVKAKEYYEAAIISTMKRHETAMMEPTEKFAGETSNLGGGMYTANMRPAIKGTSLDAAKEYLSQNNDFVNWDKMTSTNRKLEAICSQKWLSYFGYNPLEAWFEQRRNDLPKLKASNQGQQNKLICKLPYPQTEKNLNAANVATQPVVDIYNSLVFWDKINPIVEKTELYQ